jgi:hypothetical protein
MDVTTYTIIFNGFDVDGNREYYFKELSDAFNFQECFYGTIKINEHGIIVTI